VAERVAVHEVGGSASDSFCEPSTRALRPRPGPYSHCASLGKRQATALKQRRRRASSLAPRDAAASLCSGGQPLRVQLCGPYRLGCDAQALHCPCVSRT